MEILADARTIELLFKLFLVIFFFFFFSIFIPLSLNDFQSHDNNNKKSLYSLT